MSEQPVLNQNPEPQATMAPSPSAPPSPKGNETNKAVESVIMLCSLAIVGCFFLPWIQLLFTELSGYQLQQIPGEEVKFLWAVPVTAFISLVASLTKQTVSLAAQIAGAVPFLILLYWYKQAGQDIFGALRPGAYLTLFLGAVLFVAPRFLKKAKQ